MIRFANHILIFLSFVLLFFAVFGNRGLFHLFHMEAETETINEHNRKLESDIAALQNKLYGIQRSEAFLEKTAREQLGLSRPDDIVYVFPDRPHEKKELSPGPR